MDAAQRKSVDIAMRLIRETGSCAISEEDFAAVYEENERLRAAIAQHREHTQGAVGPQDHALWDALSPGV